MNIEISIKGDINPSAVGELLKYIQPKKEKPVKKEPEKDKQETIPDKQEVEEVEEIVSSETLRLAVQAKQKQGLTKQIKAVLNKYGCTTVPAVEKSERNAFYEEIKAL